MKLEKLQIIQQALKKELIYEEIQVDIYYYFEKTWYNLASQSAVERAPQQHLDNSKSESIAYHFPKSATAWFYFHSLACSISLTFSKSPKIDKRKKYREHLTKILAGAINEYKVTHNALTQLLAKEAFRDVLKTSWEKISRIKPLPPEIEENATPRNLALLALDIDYFKQVNDTWGHLYGDQVLKVFALRLEKIAQDIISSGIGTPIVHIGHPSGEEFFVLIEANATKEQFANWAEIFRAKIDDEVLPTELEWQKLKSQEDLSVLQPPTLPERKITASIGAILYSDTLTTELETDPISILLDRADIALYKAKASGRNQVIFFDEILTSYGQILEYDPITEVVAINIGSNVGVTLGQEFRAFSKTYTGRTKFSINDGRTTRTLGYYPRVESGRIIVFNTQPEISFAYIPSGENCKNTFQPGFHLEAIPAGSIGHLLPSSSRYLPTSDHFLGSGTKRLKEFITNRASKNEKPFAIIIRFSRDLEYLRNYGIAPLNSALARLYQSAQSAFKPGMLIEVIDRGSICIAGIDEVYEEQAVIDFVNTMATQFQELNIVSGVFCENDKNKAERQQMPELNSIHAIEFARFAASDPGRLSSSRVRHFDYTTAADVLNALRGSHLFKIAYADFELLKNLGVESPALYNIAGLLAGSLGNRRQGLEHFEYAINKSPENIIFKSNYGTYAYKLDEVDLALRILKTLSDSEVEHLKSLHSYGFVTYARLLAKARIESSPEFDLDRFLLIANDALQLPGYIDSSESKIIKIALTMD
jgi:diguanylate cyclase (GGDEF)-like protein